MTLTAGPTRGRPGVFLVPGAEAARLDAVRLDITGFVGVALRGPVDVPVAVSRWSDYERRFGGFERTDDGPERLLPHAVSTYFRQGGRLAYVLRVAPHGSAARGTDTDSATARFRLPLPGSSHGGPLLAAADEGVWGGSLRIRLRYVATERVSARIEAATRLRMPPGTSVPVGSLLRVWGGGMEPPGQFLWVENEDGQRLPGADRLVDVNRPLPDDVRPDVEAEVVTGALDVDDGSAPDRQGERLSGLGLRVSHPRFLPTVLGAESTLLAAVGDWSAVDLTPGPTLTPLEAVRESPGTDRSPMIDYEAFFDAEPVDVDPLDENEHVGVDRLARVEALGLMCVPDLTWRSYAEPSRPRATPTWVPRVECCTACRPADAEPDYGRAPAVPSGLDARGPGDLAEIERRQLRAADVAAAARRFVLLLDVPDGLSVRQVARWRARFDTSYAAAYHPWLAVAATDPSRGGAVDRAVPVPPSAFAAGIVAERELRLGLPWGPANELASGAVRAESVVTDDAHDLLHQLGVNVYRRERDGFRLTAGRTLSSDPEYQQLSVRRLMTTLRLSLERETQWLAFEPNTAELRERLQRVLVSFLRGLQRRGAFAGATEAESFFVSCGDDLNPSASLAQGRLIAEIGVAPSSPLEFVLVRIARDVDGGLSVEGGVEP